MEHLRSRSQHSCIESVKFHPYSFSSSSSSSSDSTSCSTAPSVSSGSSELQPAQPLLETKNTGAFDTNVEQLYPALKPYVQVESDVLYPEPDEDDPTEEKRESSRPSSPRYVPFTSSVFASSISPRRKLASSSAGFTSPPGPQLL